MQKCCSVSTTFLLKFTAYFRLELFAASTIFYYIFLNVVAIKSIQNYLRKSCSTLAPKMFAKWTPWLLWLSKRTPSINLYLLPCCSRSQGKFGYGWQLLLCQCQCCKICQSNCTYMNIIRNDLIREGRLSTVDLLVLTCFCQLFL